ncbi:hypothetical protein GINT2_002000 [Glugoides intestinalis]
MIDNWVKQVNVDKFVTNLPSHMLDLAMFAGILGSIYSMLKKFKEVEVSATNTKKAYFYTFLLASIFITIYLYITQALTLVYTISRGLEGVATGTFQVVLKFPSVLYNKCLKFSIALEN